MPFLPKPSHQHRHHTHRDLHPGGARQLMHPKVPFGGALPSPGTTITPLVIVSSAAGTGRGGHGSEHKDGGDKGLILPAARRDWD